MSTIKRVGLSSVDVARNDAVISWNHHAPATHGMLQIDLELNGDVIKSATPRLGSMHRGAEKLFESRDYRQVLGLANRHEWLSAFSGEVGIACLIEREIGIDVPQSAKWLRTLLLEVFRISSHLSFIAGFPYDNAQLTDQIRKIREHIVAHLRAYTGSRMHPMLTQIGGLTHAPTENWLTELKTVTALVTRTINETVPEISDELVKFENAGMISSEDVMTYSLSGPVARASGVAIDIRTSSPQLNYSQLQTTATSTEQEGDVPARIRQLCNEVITSCSMVDEIVDRTRSYLNEEVNVLIPKVLRVPEGEYEYSIETPLGIASWLLVSKGDKYPYRLALRPASLHTVLALSVALKNEPESNLPYILASMPFVTGDADR